jgi:hypothetical protein
MSMSKRWWRQAAITVALVSAACGSNPIGPSNQPQIANVTDNFQFQASNLTGATQTLTYTWPNSGASASIDVSGQITAGDATLVLRDGSGAQVHTTSLKTTGSFASAAGTPGNWRIDLQLSNTRGTLNFRVQKR